MNLRFWIAIHVLALMPGICRAQESIAQGRRQAANVPVEPAAFAEIDLLVNRAIDHREIPGAVVLIGLGDDIIYRKAYGDRALLPDREPMTSDTIFDLASLSKPVSCATSIMLLAERGKIDPRAPVATYLPAFAQSGKDRITVSDLLLHRAGLPGDNELSDYAAGPASALQTIFAAPPAYEPGSRFVYSDVGYIILGKLVEAVDGRPLDQFAHDEIFQPLGMHDTGYNPPASLRPRIAPTQQRDGRWMRGEVHDPRSYALGGVAGHAGLFSTADDLSRFCRMLLDGGRVDGRRILSNATVAEMTRPRCLPDGTGLRTWGFDVATPFSFAPRGNGFEPGTTFGHTGFTGTMFWIDSLHDCYLVLLTNAVHPDGKGSVAPLRRAVSTAVARILRVETRPVPAPREPSAVSCGIDLLKAEHFKRLAGLRIALLTNATGRDRDGNRSIDLLHAARDVQLVRILSPEHGLSAQHDAPVADSVDTKTGLAVFSLYGATTRPTDEMLAGIDAIVFDIQDAGARYYTFITTMGLCMEACARHLSDRGQPIRFVVLDRPNPTTGLIVDGPIADPDRLGFTAFASIPVSHGLTVGELARYFNTELQIGCDLDVVPMTGWRRSMTWDETGLEWTNPSPNLRSPDAALLYLGIGLLETTNLSVGRGTDTPFEVIGAPWIDSRHLAASLNASDLPGVRFVPITFTPAASQFAGVACPGVRIEITDRLTIEPVRLGLTIAWKLHHLFADNFQENRADALLDSRATLQALESVERQEAIPQAWEQSLRKFKVKRRGYMMY